MDIERMNLSDQRANRSTYSLIELFGIDDGWIPEVKGYNFGELISIGERAGYPLRGSSVLDVGCGTGDFFPVLESQEVAQYLGIDVLSHPVMKARQKYPQGAFRQGDFLVEPYAEKFDFVFCSGALTARLESGNYTYLERMLKRMNAVSVRAVAFNYLVRHEEDPNQEEMLAFLYERDKVQDICARVFPGMRLEMVTSMIANDTQDTVFVIKS